MSIWKGSHNPILRGQKTITMGQLTTYPSHGMILQVGEQELLEDHDAIHVFQYIFNQSYIGEENTHELSTHGLIGGLGPGGLGFESGYPYVTTPFLRGFPGIHAEATSSEQNNAGTGSYETLNFAQQNSAGKSSPRGYFCMCFWISHVFQPCIHIYKWAASTTTSQQKKTVHCPPITDIMTVMSTFLSIRIPGKFWNSHWIAADERETKHHRFTVAKVYCPFSVPGLLQASFYSF